MCLLITEWTYGNKVTKQIYEYFLKLLEYIFKEIYSSIIKNSEKDIIRYS